MTTKFWKKKHFNMIRRLRNRQRGLETRVHYWKVDSNKTEVGRYGDNNWASVWIRQGGSNLQDESSINLALPIQKANWMRQSIGAVRAEKNILSPLCLFVETLPINKAVASKHGKRILTQEWHVQIANKRRSSQCRTIAELLSSSWPTSFFITIYLSRHSTVHCL